jgi:hypothetical protein
MWTDAARQAAIEARRTNAASKKQEQPAGKKRGPQTQYGSAGTRVAMAIRNKQLHDAGREQRMAAAAQKAGTGAHSAGIASVPRALGGAGAGFLGALLGLGGALAKGATANLRSNNRR